MQLAESEQRAGALQQAMERLSAALAVESGTKDEAPSAPAALADGTVVHERLLQLQSALAAGEHDRRALQVAASARGWWWGTRTGVFLQGGHRGCHLPPSQEGLEVARRALAEAREEKGALREQLRELREEQEALQRSKEELEAQLRQQQEVRTGGCTPRRRGGAPPNSLSFAPRHHPLPTPCSIFCPPAAPCILLPLHAAPYCPRAMPCTLLHPQHPIADI